MRYRELDPASIVDTALALQQRITERFPDSGLSRVSEELLAVSREAATRTSYFASPLWPVRVGVSIAVAAILVLVVLSVLMLRVSTRVGGISELLQGIDAAVNDVIFIGIAIFFLVSIEGRIKRRHALRALHELRSLAHIIDMHQLTKDPEQVLSPAMAATASSPERTMTRFELARYLDYCSELLSVTSNLAALHVQRLTDPVVLGAVSDIQALVVGLSGKIWQKIMILDAVAPAADRTVERI